MGLRSPSEAIQLPILEELKALKSGLKEMKSNIQLLEVHM